MSRAKIEVVMTVDYDEPITDAELHAAIDRELPGMTLIEGKPSAVIDDIVTVWVRG